MIVVDTSVWVAVLRDAGKRTLLEAALGGEAPLLTRFTQLELLQGTRNEDEWEKLATYLEGQEYVELEADSWPQAARIYFDLRRRGKTVRSAIDCGIAQLAIEHGALLLHCDRDFEAIATVSDLRHRHLSFGP